MRGNQLEAAQKDLQHAQHMLLQERDHTIHTLNKEIFGHIAVSVNLQTVTQDTNIN